MQSKVLNALEEIELLNKRRKIIDKLDNLLSLLNVVSNTPIKDINESLKNEEYLINLISSSLGEQSWKDCFIILIAQESDIASPSNEKVSKKIKEIASKLKQLKASYYTAKIDTANFDSLQTQIDLLNTSLESEQ